MAHPRHDVPPNVLCYQCSSCRSHGDKVSGSTRSRFFDHGNLSDFNLHVLCARHWNFCGASSRRRRFQTRKDVSSQTVFSQLHRVFHCNHSSLLPDAYLSRDWVRWGDSQTGHPICMDNCTSDFAPSPNSDHHELLRGSKVYLCKHVRPRLFHPFPWDNDCSSSWMARHGILWSLFGDITVVPLQVYDGKHLSLLCQALLGFKRCPSLLQRKRVAPWTPIHERSHEFAHGSLGLVGIWLLHAYCQLSVVISHLCPDNHEEFRLINFHAASWSWQSYLLLRGHLYWPRLREINQPLLQRVFGYVSNRWADSVLYSMAPRRPGHCDVHWPARRRRLNAPGLACILHFCLLWHNLRNRWLSHQSIRQVKGWSYNLRTGLFCDWNPSNLSSCVLLHFWNSWNLGGSNCCSSAHNCCLPNHRLQNWLAKAYSRGREVQSLGQNSRGEWAIPRQN